VQLALKVKVASLNVYTPFNAKPMELFEKFN